MTTKLNKHFLAALATLFTLLTTAAAHAQSSPELVKAENSRWYAIAAAIGDEASEGAHRCVGPSRHVARRHRGVTAPLEIQRPTQRSVGIDVPSRRMSVVSWPFIWSLA